MRRDVRAADALAASNQAEVPKAVTAAARFYIANLLGRFAHLIPAVALGACSAELPDCPPGTNFDDCRPVLSNNPQVQNQGGTSATASTGGTGGTGSTPSGGSGGTGSTSPPSGEGGTMPTIQPGMGGMTSMAGTGSMPAVDMCPQDPNKNEPGECGCGVPDSDFDGDDAVDCLEACPDNPDRTEPTGACGCSSLADANACNTLRAALRNLYTFDGEGTTIEDLIGNDDGTLIDGLGTAGTAIATAQVNGRLNFDGASLFVELPQNRISVLTNATFEAWVGWNGGAAWARIFDFGNSVGGNGQTYLFLTPANSLTNTLRVAYSVAGPGDAETLVDGAGPLPIASAGSVTHVAVVVNDAAGTMQLFLNGNQAGTVALAGSLNAITDTNNWLGRSNYSADPFFFGSLIEFRIYDEALSAAQISTSFQAGPGALTPP